MSSIILHRIDQMIARIIGGSIELGAARIVQLIFFATVDVEHHGHIRAMFNEHVRRVRWLMGIASSSDI